MKVRKALNDIGFSFPVQLLLLHFRGNITLLGIWLVLIMLVSGTIGSLLGFHFLFLVPEYLGEVGFLSYSLLGMAFGGFFMTWNLTIYLLEAHRFPFLATLSRPFTKFCLNNLLLPLLFFIAYFVLTIRFQLFHELWSASTVITNCLGVLAGAIVFIFINILYFQYTNKDIFSLFKISAYTPETMPEDSSLAPGKRVPDLQGLRAGKARLPVHIYLNESLRPRLVRSVRHYDSKALLRVFKQNHLNALLVQTLSLLVLVGLGYLVDVPLFLIPAGASIFVIVSVMTALIGAITYWFHEWRMLVMLLLLWSLNYLTSRDVIEHQNKAYGLEYSDQLVSYDYESLQDIVHPDTVAADIQNTIQILENWKARTGQEKPKMVAICVTGGGLRSAVWSMHSVQQLDKLTEGQFFKNTALITGSSGGTMGMAYLRELYLQRAMGKGINPLSDEYVYNMSKDILNAIAFTIVTTDLFLPWATFEYKGNHYPKDRGYMFEKQLNRNTYGVMDKPLNAYAEPEKQALIPMLMLSPSVINDGRSLVISPQGVSYMMCPPLGISQPQSVELDAIDFRRLFSEVNADELRFTSALRMNATFPYVLPNVALPTDPSVKVMDAGFRDNYGVLAATRFAQVFKKWIKENTSGIMILQIRGANKFEKTVYDSPGMIESIFEPFGVAGRLTELQEFENDASLGYLHDLLGNDYFQVKRLVYYPHDKNDRASVTFHLTQREKADILGSFEHPANAETINEIKEAVTN